MIVSNKFHVATIPNASEVSDDEIALVKIIPVQNRFFDRQFLMVHPLLQFDTLMIRE